MTPDEGFLKWGGPDDDWFGDKTGSTRSEQTFLHALRERTGV